MNNSSTFFRAELLDKINSFCVVNNLNTYFHLKYDKPIKSTNPIKEFINKFIDYRYRKAINKYNHKGFLKEDSISLNEVDNIFNSSKVVLDLNHRNRQGMTINCITALAKNKKLITTNNRIIEEEFYNPNNILVIDENKPVLNIDFFKNEVTPIDIEHLRLDNWLKLILNR